MPDGKSLSKTSIKISLMCLYVNEHKELGDSNYGGNIKKCRTEMENGAWW